MKNPCLILSFRNHVRDLLEAAFYGLFMILLNFFAFHSSFLSFFHVSFYLIGMSDCWQHCQVIHPLLLLCFRFIIQSLEWLSRVQILAWCSSQWQTSPQWHSQTNGIYLEQKFCCHSPKTQYEDIWNLVLPSI